MKIYLLHQLFPALFFLLCIQPGVLFAQEEINVRELYVEAESYFLFEEYKDALPLYQRILQTDPENFNINYKIGICYLNDIYQEQKSIPYLEKAVNGISSSYKTNSHKERNAPPEAFYYLGNAYRVNNRLNEAIDAYEQFKLILDSLVYDVELVDDQINACKVAASQETKPMYFFSVNLGEGINDRFEEINPLVSGDESVLVFTRRLQFYDAVFYSKKENGSWGYPINLTPSFAVDGDSYCTGISYKGDELFVYRSDNFDGNIYVSHFKNNNWTKLEKLNSNINTKYWESHASPSKDGRTLYFTSNRKDGYGGLDIYKSERSRGGDWGPAINLGPVINSKYNEDTPFVTDDGKTLYFSSMGHYNMGGYDIFYSTRLDNGQWSKPINAGYPLNTTNDDLFFFPVRDGAFAYYAKYNPSDSYGLTDIYKLEVFTDLHPRKFILNGITRLEGQVKPNFSRIVAVLMDSKTGKVIDRTNLAEDGTFTLNALSGDFDLQISGAGINPSVEKLSIPINNPSNIITHSTLLTAAAVALDVAAQAEVQSKPETILPSIRTDVTAYEVTTGESIPIRLELDRNTTLTVETFLNGELRKTEKFDIRRRRFVYMLIPQPGQNLLRFTLTDVAGNSSSIEVTAVYTPAPGEITSPVPERKVILADSNRYMGLKFMPEGNLEKFISNLNLQAGQFKSISDLYNYLVENAAENGFTLEEVENLIIGFLAQKDLPIFFDDLRRHAGDSLVKTLDNLELSQNNIYTSEALLDYLFDNWESGNYRLDELRETLYKTAAENKDAMAYMDLLKSYATGDLNAFLGNMKQIPDRFPDAQAVADYLLKAVENGEIVLPQLEALLRAAASQMDVHFLYQSLLLISSDKLRETLLQLDLRQDSVNNAFKLITYLMKNADINGYSKKELLDNIEKIRRDPYYYVDLFRKMLAEKATGSLKVFLQEIDIRGLKLNTFEELVDYLLVQSQFHDFNREMIYQLLLDIIDPKNVQEFIGLLKHYGDERIKGALDATDLTLMSRPIEVVQYLLTVSSEYNYTDRDLLRLLLKIMFRKGQKGIETGRHGGWFANLDKPALITTLVVVNALIIFVLIIFVIRKKRKNEKG
jgi:hypothetical protein